MADTLIGVAIAWIFSYVLPSWERSQLPGLVARTLSAQARHARVALGLGQLKAVDNERKHGIPFDEAKTVFLDPFAETFHDPDHSVGERRFITIGVSAIQRLLFVAHADSGDDRVRIISARHATRGETNAHQERNPKRP